MGKIGVTVIYEISGPAETLLVQVPLLQTDGDRTSRIEAGRDFFRVFYRGHVYEVRCLGPASATAFSEDFAAPNRNGIYKVGVFKAAGKSLACRFSLE